MGILLKLLMLLTIKKSVASPIQVKEGNYCVDDIHLYMDQKMNASSNHIKKQFRVAASTGWTWYYYVVVDFCSGYFVMDMNEKDSSICTNPQYGSRVQTFDRVYATGGCEAFLPEDDFPNLVYP